MRYLRELPLRVILRLLPLRRRVRDGHLGGECDGALTNAERSRLAFLRWLLERGRVQL